MREREMEGGVLWDILDIHFGDAEFLWDQWERCLVAPGRTLDDVASREERRLVAHLDALLVGGAPVAKRLLIPTLEEAAGTPVAVAAYALLSSAQAPQVERVLSRVCARDEARWEAMARALELADVAGLDAHLVSLLGSPSTSTSMARVLTVLARRGLLAVPLPTDLWRTDDPELLEAAFRVTRSPSARLEPRALERGLASPVPALRRAALEAGLIHGRRAAWAACREAVALREVFVGASPFLMLALLGGEAERRLLMEGLSSSDVSPWVLFALGFSGTVDAAEACLASMRDPPLARLAAEAFCAITGLELSGPLIKEDPEVEPPLSLEDEDLDADLVPPPEEALPRPEVSQVEAWWSSHRAGFAPRVRYLRGRPWSVRGLMRELREGAMRRRHAHALELEIRTGGAARVHTRQWASRQQSEWNTLDETIGKREVRAWAPR